MCEICISMVERNRFFAILRFCYIMAVNFGAFSWNTFWVWLKKVELSIFKKVKSINERIYRMLKADKFPHAYRYKGQWVNTRCVYHDARSADIKECCTWKMARNLRLEQGEESLPKNTERYRSNGILVIRSIFTKNNVGRWYLERMFARGWSGHTKAMSQCAYAWRVGQ